MGTAINKSQQRPLSNSETSPNLRLPDTRLTKSHRDPPPALGDNDLVGDIMLNPRFKCRLKRIYHVNFPTPDELELNQPRGTGLDIFNRIKIDYQAILDLLLRFDLLKRSQADTELVKEMEEIVVSMTDESVIHWLDTGPVSLREFLEMQAKAEREAEFKTLLSQSILDELSQQQRLTESNDIDSKEYIESQVEASLDYALGRAVLIAELRSLQEGNNKSELTVDKVKTYNLMLDMLTDELNDLHDDLECLVWSLVEDSMNERSRKSSGYLNNRDVFGVEHSDINIDLEAESNNTARNRVRNIRNKRTKKNRSEANREPEFKKLLNQSMLNELYTQQLKGLALDQTSDIGHKEFIRDQVESCLDYVVGRASLMSEIRSMDSQRVGQEPSVGEIKTYSFMLDILQGHRKEVYDEMKRLAMSIIEGSMIDNTSLGEDERNRIKLDNESQRNKEKSKEEKLVDLLNQSILDELHQQQLRELAAVDDTDENQYIQSQVESILDHIVGRAMLMAGLRYLAEETNDPLLSVDVIKTYNMMLDMLSNKLNDLNDEMRCLAWFLVEDSMEENKRDLSISLNDGAMVGAESSLNYALRGENSNRHVPDRVKNIRNKKSKPNRDPKFVAMLNQSILDEMNKQHLRDKTTDQTNPREFIRAELDSLVGRSLQIADIRSMELGPKLPLSTGQVKSYNVMLNILEKQLKELYDEMRSLVWSIIGQCMDDEEGSMSYGTGYLGGSSIKAGQHLNQSGDPNNKESKDLMNQEDLDKKKEREFMALLKQSIVSELQKQQIEELARDKSVDTNSKEYIKDQVESSLDYMIGRAVIMAELRSSLLENDTESELTVDMVKTYNLMLDLVSNKLNDLYREMKLLAWSVVGDSLTEKTFPTRRESFQDIANDQMNYEGLLSRSNADNVDAVGQKDLKGNFQVDGAGNHENLMARAVSSSSKQAGDPTEIGVNSNSREFIYPNDINTSSQLNPTLMTETNGSESMGTKTHRRESFRGNSYDPLGYDALLSNSHGENAGGHVESNRNTKADKVDGQKKTMSLTQDGNSKQYDGLNSKNSGENELNKNSAIGDPTQNEVSTSSNEFIYPNEKNTSSQLNPTLMKKANGSHALIKETARRESFQSKADDPLGNDAHYPASHIGSNRSTKADEVDGQNKSMSLTQAGNSKQYDGYNAKNENEVNRNSKEFIFHRNSINHEGLMPKEGHDDEAVGHMGFRRYSQVDKANGHQNFIPRTRADSLNRSGGPIEYEVNSNSKEIIYPNDKNTSAKAKRPEPLITKSSRRESFQGKAHDPMKYDSNWYNSHDDHGDAISQKGLNRNTMVGKAGDTKNFIPRTGSNSSKKAGDLTRNGVKTGSKEFINSSDTNTSPPLNPTLVSSEKKPQQTNREPEFASMLNKSILEELHRDKLRDSTLNTTSDSSNKGFIKSQVDSCLDHVVGRASLMSKMRSMGSRGAKNNQKASLGELKAYNFMLDILQGQLKESYEEMKSLAWSIIEESMNIKADSTSYLDQKYVKSAVIKKDGIDSGASLLSNSNNQFEQASATFKSNQLNKSGDPIGNKESTELKQDGSKHLKVSAAKVERTKNDTNNNSGSLDGKNNSQLLGGKSSLKLQLNAGKTSKMSSDKARSKDLKNKIRSDFDKQKEREFMALLKQSIVSELQKQQIEELARDKTVDTNSKEYIKDQVESSLDYMIGRAVIMAELRSLLENDTESELTVDKVKTYNLMLDLVSNKLNDLYSEMKLLAWSLVEDSMTVKWSKKTYPTNRESIRGEAIYSMENGALWSESNHDNADAVVQKDLQGNSRVGNHINLMASTESRRSKRVADPTKNGMDLDYDNQAVGQIGIKRNSRVDKDNNHEDFVPRTGSNRSNKASDLTENGVSGNSNRSNADNAAAVKQNSLKGNSRVSEAGDQKNLMSLSKSGNSKNRSKGFKFDNRVDSSSQDSDKNTSSLPFTQDSMKSHVEDSVAQKDFKLNSQAGDHKNQPMPRTEAVNSKQQYEGLNFKNKADNDVISNSEEFSYPTDKNTSPAQNSTRMTNAKKPQPLIRKNSRRESYQGKADDSMENESHLSKSRVDDDETVDQKGSKGNSQVGEADKQNRFRPPSEVKSNSKQFVGPVENELRRSSKEFNYPRNKMTASPLNPTLMTQANRSESMGKKSPRTGSFRGKSYDSLEYDALLSNSQGENAGGHIGSNKANEVDGQKKAMSLTQVGNSKQYDGYNAKNENELNKNSKESIRTSDDITAPSLSPQDPIKHERLLSKSHNDNAIDQMGFRRNSQVDKANGHQNFIPRTKADSLKRSGGPTEFEVNSNSKELIYPNDKNTSAKAKRPEPLITKTHRRESLNDKAHDPKKYDVLWPNSPDDNAVGHMGLKPNTQVYEASDHENFMYPTGSGNSKQAGDQTQNRRNTDSKEFIYPSDKNTTSPFNSIVKTKANDSHSTLTKTPRRESFEGANAHEPSEYESILSNSDVYNADGPMSLRQNNPDQNRSRLLSSSKQANDLTEQSDKINSPTLNPSLVSKEKKPQQSNREPEFASMLNKSILEELHRDKLRDSTLNTTSDSSNKDFIKRQVDSCLDHVVGRATLLGKMRSMRSRGAKNNQKASLGELKTYNFMLDILQGQLKDSYEEMKSLAWSIIEQSMDIKAGSASNLSSPSLKASQQVNQSGVNLHFGPNNEKTELKKDGHKSGASLLSNSNNKASTSIKSNQFNKSGDPYNEESTKLKQVGNEHLKESAKERGTKYGTINSSSSLDYKNNVQPLVEKFGTSLHLDKNNVKSYVQDGNKFSPSLLSNSNIEASASFKSNQLNKSGDPIGNKESTELKRDGSKHLKVSAKVERTKTDTSNNSSSLDGKNNNQLVRGKSSLKLELNAGKNSKMSSDKARSKDLKNKNKPGIDKQKEREFMALLKQSIVSELQKQQIEELARDKTVDTNSKEYIKDQVESSLDYMIGRAVIMAELRSLLENDTESELTVDMIKTYNLMLDLVSNKLNDLYSEMKLLACSIVDDSMTVKWSKKTLPTRRESIRGEANYSMENGALWSESKLVYDNEAVGQIGIKRNSRVDKDNNHELFMPRQDVKTKANDSQSMGTKTPRRESFHSKARDNFNKNALLSNSRADSSLSQIGSISKNENELNSYSRELISSPSLFTQDSIKHEGLLSKEGQDDEAVDQMGFRRNSQVDKTDNFIPGTKASSVKRSDDNKKTPRRESFQGKDHDPMKYDSNWSNSHDDNGDAVSQKGLNRNTMVGKAGDTKNLMPRTGSNSLKQADDAMQNGVNRQSREFIYPNNQNTWSQINPTQQATDSESVGTKTPKRMSFQGKAHDNTEQNAFLSKSHDVGRIGSNRNTKADDVDGHKKSMSLTQGEKSQQYDGINSKNSFEDEVKSNSKQTVGPVENEQRRSSKEFSYPNNKMTASPLNPTLMTKANRSESMGTKSPRTGSSRGKSYDPSDYDAVLSNSHGENAGGHIGSKANEVDGQKKSLSLTQAENSKQYDGFNSKNENELNSNSREIIFPRKNDGPFSKSDNAELVGHTGFKGNFRVDEANNHQNFMYPTESGYLKQAGDPRENELRRSSKKFINPRNKMTASPVNPTLMTQANRSESTGTKSPRRESFRGKSYDPSDYESILSNSHVYGAGGHMGLRQNTQDSDSPNQNRLMPSNERRSSKQYGGFNSKNNGENELNHYSRGFIFPQDTLKRSGDPREIEVNSNSREFIYPNDKNTSVTSANRPQPSSIMKNWRGESYQGKFDDSMENESHWSNSNLADANTKSQMGLKPNTKVGNVGHHENLMHRTGSNSSKQADDPREIGVNSYSNKFINPSIKNTSPQSYPMTTTKRHDPLAMKTPRGENFQAKFHDPFESDVLLSNSHPHYPVGYIGSNRNTKSDEVDSQKNIMPLAKAGNSKQQYEGFKFKNSGENEVNGYSRKFIHPSDNITSQSLFPNDPIKHEGLMSNQGHDDEVVDQMGFRRNTKADEADSHDNFIPGTKVSSVNRSGDPTEIDVNSYSKEFINPSDTNPSAKAKRPEPLISKSSRRESFQGKAHDPMKNDSNWYNSHDDHGDAVSQKGLNRNTMVGKAGDTKNFMPRTKSNSSKKAGDPTQNGVKTGSKEFINPSDSNTSSPLNPTLVSKEKKPQQTNREPEFASMLNKSILEELHRDKLRDSTLDTTSDYNNKDLIKSQVDSCLDHVVGRATLLGKMRSMGSGGAKNNQKASLGELKTYNFMLDILQEQLKDSYEEMKSFVWSIIEQSMNIKTGSTSNLSSPSLKASQKINQSGVNLHFDPNNEESNVFKRDGSEHLKDIAREKGNKYGTNNNRSTSDYKHNSQPFVEKYETTLDPKNHESAVLKKNGIKSGASLLSNPINEASTSIKSNQFKKPANTIRPLRPFNLDRLISNMPLLSKRPKNLKNKRYLSAPSSKPSHLISLAHNSRRGSAPSRMGVKEANNTINWSPDLLSKSSPRVLGKPRSILKSEAQRSFRDVDPRQKNSFDFNRKAESLSPLPSSLRQPLTRSNDPYSSFYRQPASLMLNKSYRNEPIVPKYSESWYFEPNNPNYMDTKPSYEFYSSLSLPKIRQRHISDDRQPTRYTLRTNYPLNHPNRSRVSRLEPLNLGHLENSPQTSSLYSSRRDLNDTDVNGQRFKRKQNQFDPHKFNNNEKRNHLDPDESESGSTKSRRSISQGRYFRPFILKRKFVDLPLLTKQPTNVNNRRSSSALLADSKNFKRQPGSQFISDDQRDPNFIDSSASFNTRNDPIVSKPAPGKLDSSSLDTNRYHLSIKNQPESGRNDPNNKPKARIIVIKSRHSEPIKQSTLSPNKPLVLPSIYSAGNNQTEPSLNNTTQPTASNPPNVMVLKNAGDPSLPRIIQAPGRQPVIIIQKKRDPIKIIRLA